MRELFQSRRKSNSSMAVPRRRSIDTHQSSARSTNLHQQQQQLQQQTPRRQRNRVETQQQRQWQSQQAPEQVQRRQPHHQVPRRSDSSIRRQRQSEFQARSRTRPPSHPQLQPQQSLRGRRAFPANHSLRSQRSASQPSTVSMTDYRSTSSVTVPTFVQGTPSISRMSDDETSSWISGVESHRSAGGTSVSSANNPYLRDGKVIKRIIDGMCVDLYYFKKISVFCYLLFLSLRLFI